MRACKIYGDKATFSHVRVGQGADWAGLICQPFLNLVGLDVERTLDMRAAKCGGVWLTNASLPEGKFESARLGEHFQKEADESQRTLLGRFDGCRFGPVDFSDVHFPYETTFGGYADMRPARFEDSVKICWKSVRIGDHRGSASFS